MARYARTPPGCERKQTATLTRRRWLLASAALPVYRVFAAARLTVAWDGDDVRVAAPELHFLTGKPLDRLRDGAAVVFLTQLTLTTDNFSSVLRRAPERFVFSYDLWEEKFSVTKLGPGQRTVSRLTAVEAEAWCIDNVAISATGLRQNRPFWLRFEMRVAEPRDEVAVIGDSGLNLTRLIEIFSRRPRDQQPQWTLETGPLRLSDLHKLTGRPPRSS